MKCDERETIFGIGSGMVIGLIIAVLFILFGCGAEVDETASSDTLTPAAPALQPTCPNFLWQNTFRMAFIPAGHFTMGNDVVILDHLAHTFQAYTDSYYIDMYEVTVSEFDFFVEVSGYQRQSPST